MHEFSKLWSGGWWRRELGMVHWDLGCYITGLSLSNKKVQLILQKSTINQKKSDRLFKYHKKSFYCVGYVDGITLRRILIGKLAYVRKGSAPHNHLQRGDDHPTAITRHGFILVDKAGLVFIGIVLISFSYYFNRGEEPRTEKKEWNSCTVKNNRLVSQSDWTGGCTAPQELAVSLSGCVSHIMESGLGQPTETQVMLNLWFLISVDKFNLYWIVFSLAPSG